MTPKPLSTQDFDMLILVRNGKKFLGQISTEMGMPITTVKDRLDKLVQKGYLVKEIAFNKRPYSLTEVGTEAVTVFLCTLRGRKEKGSSTLRAHKVVWYMDIVKSPPTLKEDLTGNAFSVSPVNKNWSRYIKHEEDYKVVFNPRKVYVYIDEFFIDTPLEYYPRAMEKVEAVKKKLEAQFPGIELGTPAKKMVVASNHIVKKFGPLAMKFWEESVKQGEPIVYHGDRLQIDYSDGDPEEETVDRRTAPADMEFLGQWFNQLIEKPIEVSELHRTTMAASEAKHGLDGLKAQLDEQARHGDEQVRVLGEQARQAHEQVTSQVQVLSGQVQAGNGLLESAAKTILLHGEELRSQGIILGRNVEMQGQNNEMLHKLVMNHEDFAIAMREHVVLVKGLQEGAIAMRHGIDEVVLMVTQALAVQQKLHNDSQQQTTDLILKFMGEVLEAQKPWYQKWWERWRKSHR
jgi:DNA-binding MarR family transcriptional regulator